VNESNPDVKKFERSTTNSNSLAFVARAPIACRIDERQIRKTQLRHGANLSHVSHRLTVVLTRHGDIDWRRRVKYR
jgi:hypothetical protein